MASSQRELLTTTPRIVAAIVVTSVLFLLSLRDVLITPSLTRPLFDFFGVSSGWKIAWDVFLYGYLAWLAYGFISGTTGRERLFVACWFTGILTSPVVALGRDWRIAQDYVGSASMGVALIVAISILGEKRDASASINTASP